MRFGTYFFLQATPGRSAPDVITAEMDQMVLSEDLGFDSVWLTEHHFSDYGLSAAPSVLAATLAARTTRIRIGTAVYVIPFHHPIRLAEETATLDILSGGGRLVVGIGRGNRPRRSPRSRSTAAIGISTTLRSSPSR
jgi:alkanesulfonate monooxygenase SsuD/methylene tetrahydromethanopterin reductase-like flavin-dependent oxidoreductase (luciferase family)